MEEISYHATEETINQAYVPVTWNSVIDADDDNDAEEAENAILALEFDDNEINNMNTDIQRAKQFRTEVNARIDEQKQKSNPTLHDTKEHIEPLGIKTSETVESVENTDKTESDDEIGDEIKKRTNNVWHKCYIKWCIML